MAQLNTRETLLQKLKNKSDSVSWEDFVQTYSNYIYIVVKNLGVSHHHAEDLKQKILLTLWNKIPDFNYEPRKCKFRTWLNKVILNSVRNYRRSESRKNSRFVSVEEVNDLEDQDIDPDVIDMMDKEWKNFITEKAIANIEGEFSGKAIECFKLFCKGGKPRDIAKELDLKENTTYIFRKRVLERVRLEILRLDEDLN